jgi:hypothetical protein
MSLLIAYPEPTPQERRIFAPVERLPLPEWAEACRLITTGPAVGSAGVAIPWSNVVDPLGVPIMEAFEDRRWSLVVIMGSPQASSKTALVINLILSTLVQDRANVFYHNASATAAQDVWRKKIAPALLAAQAAGKSALGDLLPLDREEAGTRERRDFANGTCLYMRGSDSRAALAQATAMVTIGDDVQAMGTLPEGDHPADVGMERADAYPREQRRHIHLGQPGMVEDYLSRELFTSTFYMPFVPCLRCRTHQLIEWPRMQYDATDPAMALADTRMKCANGDCDHLLSHDELPAMLADHRWVSTPPKENWVLNPMPGGTWVKLSKAAVYPETDRKTTVCGFWRSALYWMFAAWAMQAVRAIEAVGHPEQQINVQKRILAIPWKEPEEDTGALTAEMMAEHQQAGHRHGKVPKAADLLTVTADVHNAFIYYIVRAWTRATGDSWLIDAGTIGVHGPRKDEQLSDAQRAARIGSGIRRALDDLWMMCEKGWPVVGKPGERMHPTLGLVDGRYRPDAVWQFCVRRNTGLGRRAWQMIFGKSSSQGAKAIWPKKPHRTKGRVYREINVDEAKHVLREVLTIPVDRPGAWHTYSDQDLEAYHRHMIAEHFVVRRRGGKDVKVWEKREGAGANHWWDCEVYEIPAAIACGVKLPGIDRRIPRQQPEPARDAGSAKAWKIGR